MSDIPATTATSTGKRRVLLVEDNQITALAYRKMLEREGFEVVHIADGANAFAAIREQKFDIVLLDLMLPELDGVEILKRNRTENQEFKTPVVVMSEANLGTVREEVLRYGAKEFFTKTGADVQKILESIRNLTGVSDGKSNAAPAIHFSHTITETLKMVPTPVIANRKISDVGPDCLETRRAGQSLDTAKAEDGRRRFLFVW